MSDYSEIFGREPEPWRQPLGALRLTLTGDAAKVDVERAQAEVEDLVKVLNQHPPVEPDWEYGISSGHGSVNYVGTRERVDEWVKSFEKAGAPLSDGERIVRRRKVGKWGPVNGDDDA